MQRFHFIYVFNMQIVHKIPNEFKKNNNKTKILM